MNMHHYLTHNLLVLSATFEPGALRCATSSAAFFELFIVVSTLSPAALLLVPVKSVLDLMSY
jgi:hypothetical protein